MRKLALLCSVAGCSFALGPVAFAGTINTIANPIDGCSGNTALYDPGEGQDIVVPDGYTVSVFAKGLNFPTGIAFRSTHKVDNLGNPARAFEVFVLESGHGLPSRCNEQGSFSGRSAKIHSRRTSWYSTRQVTSCEAHLVNPSLRTQSNLMSCSRPGRQWILRSRME